MEFAKHVRVRPERFGAVIFETLREKVFVTNKTGAEILSLMMEGKTAEEIIVRLSEDYGVGGETIRKDVEEFIARLVSEAILLERG